MTKRPTNMQCIEIILKLFLIFDKIHSFQVTDFVLRDAENKSKIKKDFMALAKIKIQFHLIE